MDDDKILARGGDETDISNYSKQNGADLTEGDVWNDVKRMSKIKRAKNEESSLKILDEKGIGYTILNLECRHYRVCSFDFWPSTGKFYNQKTGEKGRGVFNLIKLL